MKKTLLAAFVLVLVLAAALYWQALPPSSEAPSKPIATPPQPRPVPEARVDYPVETKSPEQQPELELPSGPPEGDSIVELLTWLFDGRAFERFLISDEFIQRFVTLVDNLPRRDLPTRHLPTRPTPGEFITRGEEGSWSIDPSNYKRYQPFLRLMEKVDPGKATIIYIRLYPRFQKAYEQLGYRGYFNDRLISVIDHLLATPQVKDPIGLLRPKVRYIYADPDIEALSAGRRLLIRTGPQNAALIKRLLKRYRRELAAPVPEA